MALPMAPPMISPIAAAASSEVVRASQMASAMAGGKSKENQRPAAKLAPLTAAAHS